MWNANAFVSFCNNTDTTKRSICPIPKFLIFYLRLHHCALTFRIIEPHRNLKQTPLNNFKFEKKGTAPLMSFLFLAPYFQYFVSLVSNPSPLNFLVQHPTVAFTCLQPCFHLLSNNGRACFYFALTHALAWLWQSMNEVSRYWVLGTRGSNNIWAWTRRFFFDCFIQKNNCKRTPRIENNIGKNSVCLVFRSGVSILFCVSFSFVSK